MKYKQLEIFASECQLNADEMAFTVITERNKNTILSVCQNYCNFNLFHSFGLLGWHKDFILFLYKNGEQLKRKLEVDEFMKFAQQFRIKSQLKEITDFNHFKSIKIQKYDKCHI